MLETYLELSWFSWTLSLLLLCLLSLLLLLPHELALALSPIMRMTPWFKEAEEEEFSIFVK